LHGHTIIRALLKGVFTLGLLLQPSIARARDLKEAQAEKEARRKALRDAAGEIKTTGVDVDQVTTKMKNMLFSLR
jgi:hypothetical protein